MTAASGRLLSDRHAWHTPLAVNTVTVALRDRHWPPAQRAGLDQIPPISIRRERDRASGARLWRRRDWLREVGHVGVRLIEPQRVREILDVVRRVARGQRRQLPAPLDQLQDRGVIEQETVDC